MRDVWNILRSCDKDILRKSAFLKKRRIELILGALLLSQWLDLKSRCQRDRSDSEYGDSRWFYELIKIHRSESSTPCRAI